MAAYVFKNGMNIRRLSIGVGHATRPEAATSCAQDAYDPMSFIAHPNIRRAPASANPVTKTTAGVLTSLPASGG